jgi:uncharacterized RDD family membrane protein YckC
LREYVAYAFGRPLIGILPVFVLVYVFRYSLDVKGFSQVLTAAAAAGAVFAAMSVVFVFQHDPYVDVGYWMRRILLRTRS